jgi:enoyl-CoA hydratase/carnithine racemase
VQRAKRAVEASSRLPVAEGLVYEAEQQRICLGSDDMREAITSFVEQRTPEYKGK